jgi:hypothetical protein
VVHRRVKRVSSGGRAQPTLQPPGSLLVRHSKRFSAKVALASLQKKEKEIKQVLDTMHPRALARDLRRDIKDALRAYPRPVDTMGCDIAEWKETD